MVEQMVNEVKIMYSLNHPYILKLYNHFEDDLKIYLVLEIAPGVRLLIYLLGSTLCRTLEITTEKIQRKNECKSITYKFRISSSCN